MKGHDLGYAVSTERRVPQEYLMPAYPIKGKMPVLGIYISREIAREKDSPIDLGSEFGIEEISLQQTFALDNLERPRLQPY